MLLPDRCTISRHVDGKKGNFTTEEATPLYRDVHCRVSQKSTKSTDGNGRVKIVSYYLLHLLNKQDICAGDIVNVEGYINEFKAGSPYRPAKRFKVVTLEEDSEA